VTALPGIVVVTVTRTELGDDWAPEHVPRSVPFAEQLVFAIAASGLETVIAKIRAASSNFAQTMIHFLTKQNH
jgi:hypothetical protein